MQATDQETVVLNISDVKAGMMVVRSGNLIEEVARIAYSVGDTIIVRYASGAVQYCGEGDKLTIVGGGK